MSSLQIHTIKHSPPIYNSPRTHRNHTKQDKHNATIHSHTTEHKRITPITHNHTNEHDQTTPTTLTTCTTSNAFG